MTDEIDKPSQDLTVQQRAAIGKTTRNGVSGRLKAALDDMTWNGTAWEEAARKANLTVRAMRLALKRPAVLKYLRAERGVLMAQSSAKNFHRLAALRDQDENRGAAVAAARTIEVITTETLGPSASTGLGGARAGWAIDLTEPTAGVVIQIIQGPARMPAEDPEIIDVTPSARRE